MIERSDCLLLLAELKNTGIDTKEVLTKTLRSSDVDLDVIKFINDHRQLDVTAFYEKLRKSYNNKRSDLYKNIMVELKEDNINEVLTTLGSLGLQILLFSKNVENRELFLKHARLSEIYSCLLDYSKTYNLINCVKLLELVKADIKALESTYRN